MSRPKIYRDNNGQWFWERNLPRKWEAEDKQHSTGWRTDIYEIVRKNKRLQYARFIEQKREQRLNRIFRIPMGDVRRATENITPRDERGQRVFTIYPDKGKIENEPVTVIFEHNLPISSSGAEIYLKGWPSGEGRWHRMTTDDVANNPEKYSIDTATDPVVRRWCDSYYAMEDGECLWRQLWSQRHPDVVFEHESGNLTVIEVEPRATLIPGIAQLIGDYVCNLNVDRKAAGLEVEIRGILIIDEELSPEETALWKPYMQERLCRFFRLAE